ncbi:hypothetical protein OCU04_009144 [Sclerotinia nivalis]|uniref:HNH nuclease domain-containing protein n=1 Tax=Sclerotinia nivalis TaxID=352851 RepID=A0A9X0AH13_9HELO|nr:hypothetical protein OCU04_009144 [Sclerotinia nivalis]
MADINCNVNTTENYNLPTVERVALLKQLQEAIGDVPPHFWAACQICDLDALKGLIKCGCKCPGVLRIFAQHTDKMAYYCESLSSPPKTPTLVEGPSLSTRSAKRQKPSDSPAVLHRNQKVRCLAEERDKSCCVLTGQSSIEVAHIYPRHSIKHQEEDLFGQRHIFWDHLRSFWPKEKIAVWEAELFPAGINGFGIEKVDNLITLSRNAHDMWARGAFALKPISESNDKTTLKVQFFWQKKQTDLQQTMSLLTTPFSTEGLDENIGAYHRVDAVGTTRLYRDRDGEKLRSGDYFTFQTEDPETKPLPSFALLELQWFLQRILGMVGAADVDLPSLSESGSDLDDEIYEEMYEEDYDVPGFELDTVGNPSLLSSEPLSSPTKTSSIQLVYDDLPMHFGHHVEEVEDRAEEGRDIAM